MCDADPLCDNCSSWGSCLSCVAGYEISLVGGRHCERQTFSDCSGMCAKCYYDGECHECEAFYTVKDGSCAVGGAVFIIVVVCVAFFVAALVLMYTFKYMQNLKAQSQLRKWDQVLLPELEASGDVDTIIRLVPASREKLCCNDALGYLVFQQDSVRVLLGGFTPIDRTLPYANLSFTQGVYTSGSDAKGNTNHYYTSGVTIDSLKIPCSKAVEKEILEQLSIHRRSYAGVLRQTIIPVAQIMPATKSDDEF